VGLLQGAAFRVFGFVAARVAELDVPRPGASFGNAASPAKSPENLVGASKAIMPSGPSVKTILSASTRAKTPLACVTDPAATCATPRACSPRPSARGAGWAPQTSAPPPALPLLLKRRTQRRGLARVSDKVPVLIVHQSGHLASANTAALALVGYDSTAQEARSVPATTDIMRKVADESGFAIDVVA